MNSAILFPQIFSWAKQVATSNTPHEDVTGEIIKCDGSGNIYIAGSFGGPVDFDPNAGQTNLTPSGSGSPYYLAKYSSSSTIIWVKQIQYVHGGSTTFYDNIKVKDFVLTSSGTVYLLGECSPRDNSTGNNYSGVDVFICKIDTSGTLLWQRLVSSGNDNEAQNGYGIGIDNSENIYITGKTAAYPCTAGSITLSPQKIGGFIIKYNTNGSVQWGKTIEATPSCIAVSSSGNIYTTGLVSGTQDLDPTTNAYYLTNCNFIAKYNNTGTFIWANGFTGTRDNKSIFIDNNENIYISGYFSGTTQFGVSYSMDLTSNGLKDIYFAKYISNGNSIWANKIGGTSNDFSAKIICNSGGSLYLTGNYFTGPANPVDFDSGTGVAIIGYSSTTNNTGFIAKYDTSGVYIVAKAIMPIGDYGTYNLFNDIALDNSDNIIITGAFKNTVDFDPSSSVYSLTSSIYGTENMFFAKYSPCTPPATAESIIGATTVCQGQNSVTYTVPVITNATSYIWTLPSGTTGTSTTNSITVNFGTSATSGNITVKGTNSCDDGDSSTIVIIVNPLPLAAGTISGNTTVCQGQNSVTYTVPTITNATSYVWTLPNGATGTSTTNSITVNYGTSAVSGNITVKGNNTCGDGTASTKAITVNPLPVAAGTITGTAAVCQGQNLVTYTVPTITNATSYIWTLPTGATGTSTTNNITVNYGTSAVSGNITVKGNNTCGDGTASTKAITVNPLPIAAGTITGTATVCQGQSSVTYTVPTITNATSYIWTLPTGATGTSTTNSITVNYGTSAVSGNITVKGNNTCGDGTASTKAITVNPLPVAAGTITGTAAVCQGQNLVTYTVPTITNATSYIWTLPTGATGTSTTNNITVNYGTSAVSGNITVKGNNTCGDGTASTKAITVNPLPIAAGTITGTATVCQGQSSVTYTVPTITNATSYIWTLPAGATGTSATNSITVNYGTSATSGNITVKGNNSCGDGSVSSIAIHVNGNSTTPFGIIASNDTLCVGDSSILSVDFPSTINGGLLNYSVWQAGQNGSVTGFDQYGLTSESYRINGTDPWGNTATIWESKNRDTLLTYPDNCDGGWTTSNISIDNTKLYRFSVWVKRSVSGNGNFLFGSYGSGSSDGLVKLSDGTTQLYPYFWIGTPTNDWTLVVGFIYPYDYTGTTNNPESGRYSVLNGKTGNINSDFKWLPVTNFTQHRALLNLSTDTNTTQQWIYPRIDIIDGTEPSINQLLNGFDPTKGLCTGGSWKWYKSGCGSTLAGTGQSITVTPSSTTTYYVRAEGSCNTTPCISKVITYEGQVANAGTISGFATVCQGQNAVIYTVPTITNATSYVWTLPNGATGTSTTNSITVNFGVAATSGNITVKGINSCSDGAVSTKAITVSTIPTAAGTITGNATVCQGQNNVTYTVPAIANATSYVWTLPGGATGTSATNSINVNFGVSAISGNITVKGTNACGDGTVSSKAVTVNPLPAAAGTISGNAAVCQGQNAVTYTIPTITNATSYVWTLPSGATGTSTTNSITVNYGTSAVSGNITVKGNNSCGDGTNSSLAITVTPLVAAAGTITGTTPVCQGQNAVTFSVPTIANATSYVWTLPSGATGVSNTNSISVNFGTSATSGNITVKGTNACGDGAVSTKAITVNPLPSSAGTISGVATVCQGQNNVTYTVPAVANATSYVWTLPSGATGTSSTNSITLNFGTSATSGNISVKGNNTCGEGTSSMLAITVNPLPVAAGTITGSATVCQGQNSVTYTVPAITNATSYVWNLPGGATGTSTTNSITVNFGTSATSGNITVMGTNSCGEGTVSSKVITINPLPSAAGTISGNTTVCQGQNAVTYSVPTISNATSYVWSLPSGATGTSNTNSITVNYGITAISGNITVKGNNSCGDGSASSIVIHVKGNSTTPFGIIASNDTLCVGDSSILSVDFPSTINGGLLDYSVWQDGQSGSVTGFDQSGDSIENNRLFGNDPWGNITVVWESKNTDTSSVYPAAADGGWNTPLIPIDNTKLYRFSVWVNRIVTGDGQFYLGCRGNGTTNGVVTLANGTTTTNPYFWIGSPEEGVWTLIVGHVYPHSYSGTTNHPESGLYTVNNGRIGYITSDFKWLPQTTETIHRSYLYYSTDTLTMQRWVFPRLDVIDGTEPSINQLLNGYDATKGLGTGASWTWYTDGCGSTPIGTGPSVIVTPSVTNTFYVRAEGTCNTTSCVSKAITVENQVTNAGSISGSATVCKGQNSVVYSVPAITNATSYIWTLPNGATGSSTTNSITVNYGTSAISGNITVKGSNSCGEGASSSLAVTVVPVPPANTGNDTIICQGSSIALIATGGNSYTWSNGVNQGVPFTPSATDTYTVTVSNGFCTAVDSITITISTPPTAAIIYQVGNDLQSTSSTGNQWYNDNGLISGATSPTYTPTVTSHYYVIVTDSLGCLSDTSNVLYITITLVEKFGRNNHIKIYPNPVSDELTIEVLENSDVLNIEILNAIGQVVYKGEVYEKTTVQTSQFSPGVYTIKLDNVKILEFIKLIKD